MNTFQDWLRFHTPAYQDGVARVAARLDAPEKVAKNRVERAFKRAHEVRPTTEWVEWIADGFELDPQDVLAAWLSVHFLNSPEYIDGFQEAASTILNREALDV
ncbi:MAG: hypothetical protein ABEN55_04155 [Bradymonadaceae bacterium]